MVVSPEMRSASSTPSAGRAPLEQFLRALVREVQADFKIDHRLAHHAKAKVAWLDDAGMHRPDRNLVYALAAHRLERETVCRRRRTSPARRPFAKREVVFRPERVAHQRAGIRVADGFDAEQIFDLALEARGRIVEGCQRRDRRVSCGRLPSRGRTSSPGRWRRDNGPRSALVGAAVVGDHQHQLGVQNASARISARSERVAASYLKMQFVAAPEVDVHCPGL